MQTIEIRPNKKLLIAFIGLIALVMVGMIIYIFTSNKYADNNLMKLLYVGLNAYLIFSLYKLAKRLKGNRAALTITREAIIIDDYGSEQSYKWRDIQDVSISTDDSTSYLTLKTLAGEKKVSISWLDKSPTKIKELIDVYKGSAAANSGLASVGLDE